MANEQEKTNVADRHVQEAIKAEVQRQLLVIERERAVAQYFQQQMQGILYSSFVRFVFKLDEYLKGTRDEFKVGLWYLSMICAGVVASVYVQTHLLKETSYARYKTAFSAIAVILQYEVQIYFMLLVSLITGTIDAAARDMDWVTLEISTVAICLSIVIMLSKAFFNLVATPSVSKIKQDKQNQQGELINELMDKIIESDD